MNCFISRYNTRDSSILQLFDFSSTFEYVNIAQSMTTPEALLLMDQEVAGIDARDGSLNIDYDETGAGFNLFYITFEGTLFMKSEPLPKQYKLSFMIEGRHMREEEGGEIKETVVTVKATKMDVA